eukprot:111297_1
MALFVKRSFTDACPDRCEIKMKTKSYDDTLDIWGDNNDNNDDKDLVMALDDEVKQEAKEASVEVFADIELEQIERKEQESDDFGIVITTDDGSGRQNNDDIEEEEDEVTV